MSRKEFMNKLESLLWDIPANERSEALQYYTDYFDDAGEENVEQVIRELGSPEMVASIIKADFMGGSDKGEFSETGYSDARFEKKDNMTIKEQASHNKGNAYEYTENRQTDSEHSYTAGAPEGSNKTIKVILLIILAVIALPVAIPLCIGAISVVIGIVCASFGLFAGLVIGSIAIMIAGIGLFILGMTKLLIALPSALLTSGSGLILFVLGLAATVGTVKLCLIIYPAMCRGLVRVCRLPFQRREVS